MTNASTLSRLWRSTNFTANPPAKWRTTRPMAFPTARTVAISGTVSAEIAAPETDISITKHVMVVPSCSILRHKALMTVLVWNLKVFVLLEPFDFVGKRGTLFIARRDGHDEAALKKAYNVALQPSKPVNVGNHPLSQFTVNRGSERNRMIGYIDSATGKLSALAPRVSPICQRIAPRKTDDDANVASALAPVKVAAIQLLRQHDHRSSGKPNFRRVMPTR